MNTLLKIVQVSINILLLLATLATMLIFGGSHGDNSELLMIIGVLIPLQVFLWWWYLRNQKSFQNNNWSWLLVLASIIVLTIFGRSIF